VALLFAFAFCEVGARVAYPAPPDRTRDPQLLYERSADVDFIHMPGQLAWVDNGQATINDLGLRGEMPPVPKPAGQVRVLAIGDSTTFGRGVEDNDTYTAELQRQLRHAFPDTPIDVVNGGVSAYDLKHELSLLRHFAPILAPDVVLLGFHWMDLPVRQVSPDGAPIASVLESEVPQEGASARRFHLGQAADEWTRTFAASRVLFMLHETWATRVRPSPAAENLASWEQVLLDGRRTAAVDRAWADLQAALADIRDLGEKYGFAPALVTLPIRAQTEGPNPHAQYQAQVERMARTAGVPAIDPLPLFLEQPDRGGLFMPYDRVHFSRSGNATIADAVFEALRGRTEFQHRETPQTGGADGEVRTDRQG
jgi:lysophospholipase L1-like esterase